MDQTYSIINLKSLLELSGRLNETHDEEFIFSSVLFSLMGKLKIVRSCVFIPRDNVMTALISKPFPTEIAIQNFEPASFIFLSRESEIENSLIEQGFMFAQPVKYRDTFIGLVCLGKKIGNMQINPEEEEYIKLVSTITANAIHNARLHKQQLQTNFELEQRTQLLSTLFESGRNFTSFPSRDEIIRMFSLNLMGQLMISRFAIYIVSDKGEFQEVTNRLKTVPSDDILQEIAAVKKITYSGEGNFSERAEEYLEFVEAMLVSPLIIQGMTRGILIIGKKHSPGKFSKNNLLFIESLGNSGMLALENERLFREELEKKRLESELLLALEIQKNLLPKEKPEIDGFDVSGVSIPSRHVGGDYYDYIRLNERQTLFVIADVSGKGMPASLLMANVQSVLRVLAPFGFELNVLLNKLNRVIYENTSIDKFVTLFAGILDSDKKTFTYINAGHNPPVFMYNDGTTRLLDEGGIILGILENPAEFIIDEVKLNQGDLILLYTDGISEAMDENSVEFDVDGIIKSMKKYKNAPSEDLLGGIVAEIRNFVHNTSFRDDLTMCVIKCISQ